MPDQRNKDLESLLTFLANWKKLPNEEELMAGIQQVIQFVQQSHSSTKAEVDKIVSTLEQIGQQISQKHDMSLEQHKTMLSGMTETTKSALEAMVKERLASLKDGMPGEIGLPGLPGKDGSPDTPDIIRNKLENLPDGEKLAISAIQGLEDKLKNLTKNSSVSSGWSSASGGKLVKSWDLSDSLNGVKTTFALPSFWRVISVHLSSVPTILRPTVDYTTDAAASSITFTSEINAATSLSAGQSLIIVYAEA